MWPWRRRKPNKMSQLIKHIKGKRYLYKRKSWRYNGEPRHQDIFIREIKTPIEHKAEVYIKNRYIELGLNCLKTHKYNLKEINQVLKTLNLPEVTWNPGIPDFFIFDQEKTWCSFIEV
jgi:hypothetical protein